MLEPVGKSIRPRGRALVFASYFLSGGMPIKGFSVSVVQNERLNQTMAASLRANPALGYSS